jgi:protein associated with RNAse G/E
MPARKRPCATTLYYRKRWAELIALLGLECAICGKREHLQVDHVDGKDWRARDLSSAARVARYWREYHEGVRMRTLCIECNSSHRYDHLVAAEYTYTEEDRV